MITGWKFSSPFPAFEINDDRDKGCKSWEWTFYCFIEGDTLLLGRTLIYPRWMQLSGTTPFREIGVAENLSSIALRFFSYICNCV